MVPTGGEVGWGGGDGVHWVGKRGPAAAVGASVKVPAGGLRNAVFVGGGDRIYQESALEGLETRVWAANREEFAARLEKE